MARDLNLPWTVERHEVPCLDRLPSVPGPFIEWLVLDCWHVVIGRFDFEEQARLAVKGANREEYAEIARHRDVMVRALATELDEKFAAKVVDTLLGRIRRVEGIEE